MMMLLRVVVAVVVVVLAVMTSRGSAVGVDRTVVTDYTGSAVVIAVVNRIRQNCVFAEDRLFLRRMAYVATRDGQFPATYNDGGIWKLTQSQFLATKNCGAATITSACQAISTGLTIDWAGSVTWSDLRKPLYSGLAAALFSLIELNSAAMPGDVTLQAQFYASAFGGSQTDFTTLAPNATSYDCGDKMDIVFVLDSSGSVSYTNFNLMRSFAADIVQVMQVGGDGARVADIVYGSNVEIVFNLNNYSTGLEVMDAIRDTSKLGGGTMTYDAIDVATAALYDSSRGARSDAKKVMVLVTDGNSFQPDLTADAAFSLRDRGTTLFSIGVGAYNLTELHLVASDTSCAHVLTLSQFSDINTILDQIQQSTCDASLIMTPGKEVLREIRDPPVELTTRTINTGPNRTIIANVTCGTLDMYLSYTDQTPSAELYEEFYRASHGVPVTITTSSSLDEESAVYVTLLATRMTSTQAANQGCTQFTWGLAVESPDQVVRLTNGARDTEGRLELFYNGAWGTVCGNNFDAEDAIVACRMLGHERWVPVVQTGGAYGAGEGAVWMDEVQCQGAEPSVWACPYTSQMNHDCRHATDVGIDCQHPNASALSVIRLVDGPKASEGRLEVWNGGTWGTVCSDSFDVTDATVVCKMLNYTGVVPQVYSTASYGQASGDIWLDDVNCQGTEASFFLCPNSGVGVHDCTHTGDVGIDCQPDGGSTGAAAGSTESSSDQTALIAGIAGGLSALLLLAGGVALLKYLGNKHAKVESINSHPNRGEGRASRMGRRSSSSSSSDSGVDTPLPGQVDILNNQVPHETRLPPLQNSNVVRFPALRS